MANSSSGRTGRRRSSSAEPTRGQRELIVIATERAGLRARPEGIASATGFDVGALNSILDAHGATLTPLFGGSEERLQAESARGAAGSGPASHRAGSPGRLRESWFATEKIANQAGLTLKKRKQARGYKTLV